MGRVHIYIYIYTRIHAYIVLLLILLLQGRHFYAIKRSRICCPLFIDLPGGGKEKKEEEGKKSSKRAFSTNESRFFERLKIVSPRGKMWHALYATSFFKLWLFFFLPSRKTSYSFEILIVINILFFQIKCSIWRARRRRRMNIHVRRWKRSKSKTRGFFYCSKVYPCRDRPPSPEHSLNRSALP